MPAPANSSVRQIVDEVFRTQSRRIFASLVRHLRDFDLSEEALNEAFAAAVEHWEVEGIPGNPVAWLISTGRFKAIDMLRRRGRFEALQETLAERRELVAESNAERAREEMPDDRLRLIFACCHPAIDPAVQVALTLREVCGLTTEEIASAFLVAPATMAQRLVRGKSKIRDAGIPFVIPSATDLAERLDSVLAVIYLVFNEGYSASSGDQLMRGELSGEAIRLGRLVVELLPAPEAVGLLALMLLQESRRAARSTSEGDIILLEDQDRTLWDTALISEGQTLVERALATRRFGSYTIQAAIAAVHAAASTPPATDWQQISELYGALYSLNPSPVIELNRAVAVAMATGPQAGLAIIDAIIERGDLAGYHLVHAARAELLRRGGQLAAARETYAVALQLARQAPEIRHLQRRIESLDRGL